MTPGLSDYEPIVGAARIEEIRTLGRHLRGVRLLHVNSTAVGGGVAEILRRIVPLLGEAGLDVRWEVIAGDNGFYRTTKSFHNGLQGRPVDVAHAELEHYLDVNRVHFPIFRERERKRERERERDSPAHAAGRDICGPSNELDGPLVCVEGFETEGRSGLFRHGKRAYRGNATHRRAM